MSIANKGARTTGAPNPATTSETAQSVAAMQKSLTRATSPEAPSGKKIKTTKAVS